MSNPLSRLKALFFGMIKNDDLISLSLKLDGMSCIFLVYFLAERGITNNTEVWDFFMRSKYNIALLPSSKSDSIVKCARFLSNIADGYLLGEFSLPHLTLYQFQTNEFAIESIWEKACNELNQTALELTFKKFSCITFDRSVFWASLLPDHGDVLMKMHSIVADIIKHPVKVSYDPHMTLLNTKDSSYEILVHKLAKTYTTPIKDVFVLALGRSDDIGQLTEVIYYSKEYVTYRF